MYWRSYFLLEFPFIFHEGRLTSPSVSPEQGSIQSYMELHMEPCVGLHMELHM